MDAISTNGSMIEQIDLSRVPRSGFDMSFHNFLTGRLGALIPTAVKEVLPGDRIKGSTHIVTNFEPLAAPIMANMVQKEETFYVPYSVIWNNSHRFFTGKKGYEQLIPSRSLYQTLGSAKVGNIISDIETCFDVADEEVKLTDMYELVRDLTSWYSAELSDLFKPLVAKLFSIIKPLQVKYPSGLIPFASVDSDDSDRFVELFQTIIYFFYGEGSMVDYLGYGCVNFSDDNDTFVFKQSGSGVPVNVNFRYGVLPLWNADGYGTALDLSDDEGNSIESLSNFVEDIFLKYYNIQLSWMPFRACYWIWYWNYRDKLIESDAYDPEENMMSDTISTYEIINCLLLRQRCWFKDSFTTALTNTGDTNMTVPVSPYEIQYSEIQDSINTDNVNTNGIDENQSLYTKIKVGSITYRIPSNYLNSNNDSNPITDTVSNGISLNLIDRARRLNSWVQKRLILGTEYDDVIYSSFMVKLSNVRMRVPELLSSSRTDVAINVVVNNTTIPDGQIAGDKSAVAYANNINNMDSMNYFAEEHGLLISYMTVLPFQSYPESMQRLLFKRNRFDFAWPEFAQLGMDAVYLSELVGQNVLSEETAYSVFGYQGRYYDYKCNQDEEHGRLHGDLNYLTFGRVWKSDELPKLNAEFVHCWPRSDMFVVDDGYTHLFRSDVHHRWAFERCLPVPSDILY